MTTEQMRQALLKAYSGDRWKQKVIKMSEAQVFAVYTKFKNQNKI